MCKIENFFTNSNGIIKIDKVYEKNRTIRISYFADGEKVIAYCSFPVNFDVSKRYPLIIFNRGGRGECGKLTPDTLTPFSMMGNAVTVGSQYNGNDGGTGRDEFCGKDTESVSRLIDIMKSQTYINDTKIYMIGFSRGGAESYILAAQRMDIRSIAVVSGVSDFFDVWEKRPEYREVLMKYIIVDTEEDRKKEFQKRSACCWAENIKQPVFIIHSEKDESVPCGQVRNLAKILKENGTFVKVKFYEDNVHGFHESDTEDILTFFGLV